jgi:hypothetical protein
MGIGPDDGVPEADAAEQQQAVDSEDEAGLEATYLDDATDRDANDHNGKRNQRARHQDSGQRCGLGDAPVVQRGQCDHGGNSDSALRPPRTAGHGVSGDGQRHCRA